MSNKAAFKMSEMNDVIFRKAADKSAGVRFMSLFPGELKALTFWVMAKAHRDFPSPQVSVTLPVTRLPSECTNSEVNRTSGMSSTGHQPSPISPTLLVPSGERWSSTLPPVV